MAAGKLAHATLTGPSVVKEIIIGMSLGLVAGGLWKMHHWNEQRKTRTFYDLLEKGQISIVAAEDFLEFDLGIDLVGMLVSGSVQTENSFKGHQHSQLGEAERSVKLELREVFSHRMRLKKKVFLPSKPPAPA